MQFQKENKPLGGGLKKYVPPLLLISKQEIAEKFVNLMNIQFS